MSKPKPRNLIVNQTLRRHGRSLHLKTLDFEPFFIDDLIKLNINKKAVMIIRP